METRNSDKFLIKQHATIERAIALGQISNGFYLSHILTLKNLLPNYFFSKEILGDKANSELLPILQRHHQIRNEGDFFWRSINGVAFGNSGILVTSLDRSLMVWEVKTGKLLREIAVSSQIDWLFPTKENNCVIAASICRKWSGGEIRKINIDTGKFVILGGFIPPIQNRWT